jgi:hypothetical protein
VQVAHRKKVQLDPSRENPTLRKFKLRDRLKMAHQDQNEAEVKRLTEELQLLEATLAETNAAASPAPPKEAAPGAPSNVWAAVNERNRKANREEQRKAELEAKRRAEMSGQPIKLDPSARVKTNVRLMHDVRWVSLRVAP